LFSNAAALFCDTHLLAALFLLQYRQTSIKMKGTVSNMKEIERYPNLFKPIRLGNTYFRNRIFSAPTGLLDLDGHKSGSFDHLAYFERKAKGGCASVNIGECTVFNYDSGDTRYDLFVMTDHVNNYNSLGKLTDAINRNGAVATAELEHFGAASLKMGLQQLAPSDGRNPLNPDIQMREMTEEQIFAVINQFADAAVYAKDRGFGMVTVHAGHGWLLSQFYSPFFNKRTDRWGGSAENRARITVSIVDEIHKRCGKGYPVEVRISGAEFFPGGYGIEGGIEFARQLDGHADLIHVSAGNPYAPEGRAYTNPNIFKEPGLNVWLAAEIKKHVKTPVATVGALSDPDQLEEIVAGGKADVVEMARGLICDPDLPVKLRTGREKEVRKCLRCFRCVEEMYQHGRLFCAINPESGKEREILSHHPVAVKKRVLVAGGGMAGMEAAITAAKNGHTVTLCEKSDALGGVLKCEVKVPFKTRLGDHIGHQIYMLNKLGVQVRLNTPVTPALVEELKPDALIMAVGGEPVRPDIPGINGSNVIGVEQAFTDPSLAGGKIVVIGAGRSGTELGIYYKELGKEVSLIEAQDTGDQAKYLAKMAEVGLETAFGLRAKEIRPDGVLCESVKGEQFIPADTVVLALGVRPLGEQVDALASFGGEFYQAGDCRSARGIIEATGEGWTMANLIGRY